MMKNTIGHIYVAAHEVCKLPHNHLYIPIFVGAFSKEKDIGQILPEYFLRDDVGENISLDNDCFSELTGLYWIWKNREEPWLGLIHYRRFFAGQWSCKLLFGKAGFKDLLTEEQLTDLMGYCDIILPGKRHYFIETLYSHYSHTFDGGHLDTTRRLIGELCPDYLPDFDHVMRMRSGYMFNMMIMKKELLDNYCSWLFPILFELKKHEMREDMDLYQRRFGGRVAERLFNVWLYHHTSRGLIDKKRIRELPVLRTDSVHWFRKITAFLLASLFHRPYKRSW